MKLVEVACPVCNGTDYTVKMPDSLGTNPPIFGYEWVPGIRKTYRMVRCSNCSHVYASPRLLDMYKYYVDNINETYVANKPLRVATARRVLEKIRTFVPRGRLIDIGCATGDFLLVASENFEVEGLELSNWARAEAEKKGLHVHKNVIAELAKSDTRYDVVTMWGVIEHLEFPLDEMRRVNRLLDPGGIVCFWTGDVDDILARMFRRNWWYVLGQHIQLFSRASLNRLLCQAGFEPVYRGIYPYVISLGYLGEVIGSYPIIGPLVKGLLNLSFLRGLTFTLELPDEIFDIYRKVRDVPAPPASGG